MQCVVWTRAVHTSRGSEYPRLAIAQAGSFSEKKNTPCMNKRAYREFVEQIELDDVWTEIEELRKVCFGWHRKNAQLRAVRSHETGERRRGDIHAIDTAMEQRREPVTPMSSDRR